MPRKGPKKAIQLFSKCRMRPQEESNRLLKAQNRHNKPLSKPSKKHNSKSILNKPCQTAFMSKPRQSMDRSARPPSQFQNK